MNLVNNKEYSCLEKDSIFQCILGSGSVTLYAKVSGVSEYSVVHTFSEDGFVNVQLPNGSIKASITGNAKLAMSTQ